MMQTDLREKYPVSKTYEILDGFDIHRTSAQIIAIVIIFDNKKNRNDIRFYRWFKNKYGEWKIPNWGISILDHPEIFTPDVINRISKLKEKYNVSERYPKDEKNDFESSSSADEEEYDEHGLYKIDE